MSAAELHARLAFRPIAGTPADVEQAVRYRRDSFHVSFGEAATPIDEEKYARWLAGLSERLPGAVAFATIAGRVVGQIEAQVRADGSGYVNLFYLAPPYRGRGLGRQLHRYVLALLVPRGVRRIELAVSPTNVRAIRFYEKLGYRSLGPRAGAVPPVDEMELRLEGSADTLLAPA